LGDALNGDRGLGFYAVRDLYREGWPQEVTFRHRAGQESSSISLEGYSNLLILDALRNGHSPGTLYRYNHDELAQHRSCLRDHRLWEAITLAELLGNRIQVSLLGIEPAELRWNFKLSETLLEVYGQFLDSVRQELRLLLQPPPVEAPIEALD
jgi:hydrogenase maturation protease